MLTPAELNAAWAEDALEFPMEALAESGLPAEAIEVLAAGALPESAAPFLDFGEHMWVEDEAFHWLGSLAQVWGLDEEPDPEGHQLIGSTGDGSPVAVDSRGAVVVLDHARDFEVEPVNDSVLNFARSLHAYAKFVERAIEEHGEDGYMGSLFSTDDLDALEQELLGHNGGSLGDFWRDDLSNLRAELAER